MKVPLFSVFLTAVILTVTATIAILPTRADDTAETITLIVTGTWSDVLVIPRVEALVPDCVSSLERKSEIAFEGTIEGTGVRQALGLINGCTNPPETNARAIFQLNSVTIGDMVGGLKLEGWVTAKGDISPPPVGQGEVTTQFRLEVVDGSGDFRKSRGFIVSVGTSTTTGSSNTYYGQVVVHPH
jgi:hypothetical protein